MPAQITPLDVTNFATPEIYQMGENLYKSKLVKQRFRTDYGLKATVRRNGLYQVEMIVENEQLFGRCTCIAGSSPCEHKVATLLAWLGDPSSFISFQSLRKDIRNIDKNALVEIFLNLSEIFPELCHFFDHHDDADELDFIRANIAETFDFPELEPVDPAEVGLLAKVLNVRAKYLRHENKWRFARVLLFELLDHILTLIDKDRFSGPLQEEFVTGIVDDYIDIVLTDPYKESPAEEMENEVNTLLSHPSSEEYGIILDPLKKKLKK